MLGVSVDTGLNSASHPSLKGLSGKKKQVDMYFHPIGSAPAGGGVGAPRAHRVALEGVPFL